MTGAQIKEIRESLGISQCAIAAAIGVPRETFNRWENDRQKPLPIYQRAILKLIEPI